MIAVSIYCYLIKYWAKQKQLLPYGTNNGLWEIKYQKSKITDKAKDIEIKHRTYYFLNDIINIKIFDPGNIKTDENSYKN